MQPSRLTLFSLLTAWANLLHQLSYPEWIKGLHSIGWLLFLFSLAGIARPSSFRIFVTLMVLRVVYTAYWIPMIRGHLFLEGLFTCGILAIFASELWKRRRFAPASTVEEDLLFESIAPLLRIGTLVVYGAVTLSKLNVDFLDPQQSAAVRLLLWWGQTNGLTPTSPWFQQVSIWGTLAFEGGIPVLLCFRKTRWLGLFLAVVFHTLMGLIPLKIASFTLTMYLLLFAWLPRDSAALIHQRFLEFCRMLKIAPAKLVQLVSAMAVLTGLLYAGRKGFGPDMHALDLGLGIWWWQTVVVALALVWVYPANAERTLPLLRQCSWISRVFVGILLFNSLCPYIGLKTRTTLSMHCNLRTEKGYWNHLFLPEQMRVFAYQDDLVSILESNLPDLDYLGRKGMPLPYLEFRRWCRLATDDFYVKYQRGGDAPLEFERKNGLGSDLNLIDGSPVLEWFLCFNPVGASHDYLPGIVSRVGPARNMVPEPTFPER
jgi:hypothetical protein